MTAQDTETSPLLRSIDSTQGEGSDNKLKLSVAARTTIAISSLILVFSILIADLLLAVPAAEVQEYILCRRRYPDTALGSNDPRCKNDDVQSELSMLQAVEVSCALLPGLLTAVPWGVVADRYGRLFVLRLTILGLVLCEGSNVVIYRFPEIFPIRLIWASPIFMVLGGGLSMAVAMVYTVASDISSEAQRSTAFFIIAAVTLIADLVSKPLTYVAMEKGAWFTIYLGYTLLVSCLVSLLIFPPILVKLGSFNLPPAKEQKPDAEALSIKAGPLQALREHISSGTRQILDSFRFLFLENKKLGLVLLTIMLSSLGKDSRLILLQYITKRFGVGWSQANLFLSINSFITLGLVLVILPGISQLLLSKMSFSPFSKDVWMARGSILLLIGGGFGIGLAATPASLVTGLSLFALGSGFSLSARSLLATLASGHHVAMLYTTITFVEVAGLFFASPVLSASFRLGLKMGGYWVGLPFLSAGCLFTLAAVIFFGVRLSDVDRADYVAPARQNETAHYGGEDD